VKKNFLHLYNFLINGKNSFNLEKLIVFGFFSFYVLARGFTYYFYNVWYNPDEVGILAQFLYVIGGFIGYKNVFVLHDISWVFVKFLYFCQDFFAVLSLTFIFFARFYFYFYAFYIFFYF
jgi:hypothetical protein